jgi:hypothetical protein
MAVGFSASGQHYFTFSPLNGTFTLTCWINLTAGSNKTAVWGTQASSAQDNYDFDADTTGTNLRVNGAGGTLGSFAISAGSWYKTAVVCDGTTTVFYHAAATAALTSDSGTIGTPSGTLAFFIGANGATASWFNGRIAAVKAWSSALTAADVERELLFYMPQKTGSLTRFHPFINAQTRDYSGLAETLSGGVGATTGAGPPIAWAPRINHQLIIPWTQPVTAVASPPFRRAPRGALLHF